MTSEVYQAFTAFEYVGVMRFLVNAAKPQMSLNLEVGQCPNGVFHGAGRRSDHEGSKEGHV